MGVVPRTTVRLPPPPSAIVTALLLGAVALPACGGDDPTTAHSAGSGGLAGSGAVGGSAANGGSAGVGGSASGGNAGVGGSASGGSAGSGGGAGSGGSAGSGPLDCANHPPLTGLNPVVKSWEDVFTHPFGGPGTQLDYPGVPLVSNVNNPSTSIDMLVLPIQVPEQNPVYDHGLILQNPDNGLPHMFFSKCPGDKSFSNARPECAANGSLGWKVDGALPNSPRCALTPGETYYLNIVFIQGGPAAQGTAVDICGALGGSGSYTVTCYYWGQHILA